MSQVLIKRSAVASKVPQTTDLALGELAINTFDGKLYLKKNVSGTESIISVGPQTTSDLPEGSNLYFTTVRAASAAPVQSVAGRTGVVTIAVGDVAGAAPLVSPVFTGVPAAPTPSTADNSTTLATTAFVKAQGYATGTTTVSSFNTRTGAVTLTSLDVTSALTFTPVSTSVLAQPSGVATLDGSGKLLTSQIPPSLVGAVVYQGVWNASTNTPTLTSGTGTKGFYYKVSVAGSTTLDGLSQWNIGDTAIYDGTTWDKIDGVASEVLSVAGRTGAVVLTSADVSGVATSGANSNITSLTGLTTPLSVTQGGTGVTASTGTGSVVLSVSPALTGVPTVPTASTADSSTTIASTAFVKAQGYATTAGSVTSVAGRTGAVVLAVADVSGAAPLASPALTGTPTAPTASTADSSTTLATTAFVKAQGYQTSAGAVTSVAGRTGAVVLAVADVTGAAALASPVFTGIPRGPTRALSDRTVAFATTAFVKSFQDLYASTPTLDPTNVYQGTLSNGNLTLTGSISGQDGYSFSTIASPNAFYFEVTKVGSNPAVLLTTSAGFPGSYDICKIDGNGNVYPAGGALLTNIGTLSSTFGISWNPTTGNVGVYSGGSNIYNHVFAIPGSPVYVGLDTYSTNNAGTVNLGGSAFTYTPPAGFTYGLVFNATSFNTRTGPITLTSSDVTSALAYTPARSGANSNITSLSGLTTPLSVAQGGPGVTVSTGSGSTVLSISPALVSPTVTSGITVSTGVLAMPNGTVSAPSINFGSATTGFFQSGANILSVAGNSSQLFDFNGALNYVQSNSLLRVAGNGLVANYGAVGTPVISFISDTTTGIYGASGTFSIAAGGVQRAVFNAAGATFTGVVTIPTAATADNSTTAASTAFVKAQGYTTGTGYATSGANSNITSLSGLTTALSVAQGGTGTTTSTGTGSVVLSASPALTGVPTAPTPVTSDSSTTIATTAFVKAVNVSTTFASQIFTATAAQTTFTIAGGYTAGLIDVYGNGYKLNSTDYTASNGTTIVFNTGLNAGDELEVVVYGPLSLASISGGGSISGTLSLQTVYEKVNIVAAAPVTTQNIDMNTSGIWSFNVNATANFTMNIRGSSSVTLDSTMTIGQAATIAVLVQNGVTGYYPTAYTIDGSAVTPKWNGAAPVAGDANAIDSYSLTIIKTAAATFTVLATVTKYA
jgi:hypothetical protein